MKIETQCLHEGYTPKNGEPRVMPIVQSTTYVYDSTDAVAAVFDDPTKSLTHVLKTLQLTQLKRKLLHLRVVLLQCAHHQDRLHHFVQF